MVRIPAIFQLFTVEFPLELTDGSRIKKKALPATGVVLNGVKILLAEDNDLNAEIAAIQLEELGIQVTRACDGEIVKIFAENPPDTYDLIFMNNMMPNKNGYEATMAIRAMRGRPSDTDYRHDRQRFCGGRSGFS